MLKNKITFLIVTTIFLTIAICTNAFAKNISSDVQLNMINTYQEKYFEIIKRNNILLNFEDNDKLNNDRQELANLFAEVENQIINKHYLNKYKKMQKRYSQCDGITTIEINACADKNYKAVNNLLNNVYKKAESKLTFENGKKLALNELQWEKDVENYHKVYDSMNFGTIGTSTYLNYESNMREFRILLLMLFL